MLAESGLILVLGFGRDWLVGYGQGDGGIRFSKQSFHWLRCEASFTQDQHLMSRIREFQSLFATFGSCCFCIREPV